MADVKGGRGVTGMSFSGKGNLEKPSSGKLARELGSTVSKTTIEKTSGNYPRIGFNAITPPGTSSRMLAQKFSTKYKPGEYAAYRKTLAAKKPPAVAAKPPAKKPPQVVSNVVREKPTPTSAKSLAKTRANPFATRFGIITGKETGTRVSGGGGYGGGGTRGGGSLSGQGSGSRSAGTSRTGGTQRNDPVRG